MTATFMFERLHTHRCSFPSEEKPVRPCKSCYKFYQFELRQLLTESHLQQEHDTKSSRQKQAKNHLVSKRLHREYMDRIQERSKMQLRSLDHDKRSSSVLSVTNRGIKEPVLFTVSSTNISTTEFKSKPILKTKQVSSSTKQRNVVNINQKTTPPKPPMIPPAIEIDEADEDLLKSNASSYTQMSSSSQNDNQNNARQSILKTIITHLNSYTSSDISKWNLYRDFDSKFSASISPKVYRNFERVIL